ncbi:MAG: hypothetical protein RL095_1040 [Verrucomicrobiota bacterium]|jgi:hypothetical protein
MSEHDHHLVEAQHEPHAISFKAAFGVTFLLIAFTLFNVFVSVCVPHLLEKFLKVHNAAAEYSTVFNCVIMGGATLCGVLVVGLFMHIVADTPVNRLTFISGTIFLGFFFLFTLSDTLTRRTQATPEFIKDHAPASFRNSSEIPGKAVLIPAKEGYQKNGEEIEGHGHGHDHDHGHSHEGHAH